MSYINGGSEFIGLIRGLEWAPKMADGLVDIRGGRRDARRRSFPLPPPSPPLPLPVRLLLLASAATSAAQYLLLSLSMPA